MDSEFSVVNFFGGAMLQRTASSYEFVLANVYADITAVLC